MSVRPNLKPSMIASNINLKAAIIMLCGAVLLSSGCVTSIANPASASANSNSNSNSNINNNLPVNLKTADNEQLVMHLPAVGVQIYECRAVDNKVDNKVGNNADNKTPKWVFVAPEADLFALPDMKRAGKHYAGPHWELNDDSKIIGTVMQRADAANTGAIPLLLLSAKSVGGVGKLSNVTRIQRLNTVGGIAPETGCASADLNTKARVYYSADYYFFAG